MRHRAFLFLHSSCRQLCVAHLLWIRQDRVCVLRRLCRMLHQRQSSFLQYFCYTPRPSQPGQSRVLPRLSRTFLLRHVGRDLTFVHSSVGRASTNVSLVLPGIELLGFHGSPTRVIKKVVPRIAARKSSHHSSHQCATWCQQNELICSSPVASKHSFVPSEFQLCLVFILVSERTNFNKLRELPLS